MRAELQRAEKAPNKFYYIWLPEVGRSWDDTFILGAGMLLSWLGIYGTLITLIDQVFFELGRRTPWGALFPAVVLACAGPVSWILLMRWLDRRRRQSPRTRRLSLLAARVATAKQSPHRLVELALRTGSPNSKRFLSCFAQVPVGSVILANWGSPRSLRPPVLSDIPFEPIELPDDRERLAWLGQINQEQPTREPSPLVAMSKSEPPPRSRRGWFSTLVQHCGFVLSLCGLLLVLTSWIAMQSRLGWTPRSLISTFSQVSILQWILLALANPCLLVLALLLVAWLISLFRERTWWLVPGGLICRSFSFWRRGVSVKLLTPADTPLLLDARSGMGIVLDEGRLWQLPCMEHDELAVLAAWISLARTPSLEEVHAFVGQESSANSQSQSSSDGGGQ